LRDACKQQVKNRRTVVSLSGHSPKKRICRAEILVRVPGWLQPWTTDQNSGRLERLRKHTVLLQKRDNKICLLWTFVKIKLDIIWSPSVPGLNKVELTIIMSPDLRSLRLDVVSSPEHNSARK